MRTTQSLFHTGQPTRSDIARQDGRVQMFVVYGAFLIIAAIVFGTLSFRPF